jgi:perosamine synthetase
MKRNKKKMLITGVSGQLGSNLAWYFREYYDVLGLYNYHEVKIEGVRTEKADILYAALIKKIIRDFHPDVLIHCASLTNIDYCEINQEKTDIVNVLGTKNIINSIKDDEMKVVYISSDSVYGGLYGDCSETDPVIPQNYYGISKYKGELETIKRANSLILRTNMFGWNIQDKLSIAEWILHELKENNQIKGFKDVCFSSIYTFDLAKILDKAIENDLFGIYNCGSRDSISKYNFALLIAKYFHLDDRLVQPISIDDFEFTAKRGKNLSLNVSKLAIALNYKLPRINDTVEAFYRDFKDGLTEKIRARMLPCIEEKRFLNYGKQSIDENDIKAVIEVLQSTHLTQGPKIPEFESALCGTVGALHAVACNSGTSALHMTCMAAGVQPGDEVITSPITFVASANCAVYCGAKPVFADIDRLTYNISPEEVAKKITGKTRVVIPVHFAGQSCNMERIQEVVRSAEKKFRKKIFIVEDASHALGSLYKNTKVGSCAYADMTVMSFHPVKHITTAEGGVVFTNDPLLLKKLRLLRSHGITSDPEDFLNEDIAFQQCEPKERNPWYYEQITLGYNYRITDLQCALGLSQIKKLETFMKQRRFIVDMYNDLFHDRELIQTPYEYEQGKSNFHLYVLLFDFHHMTLDRAKFMLELRALGIQTQVHYVPVHLQSFYRNNFEYAWGDYPIAEEYYAKCLSIPLYPAMTAIDAMRVYKEISRLVNKI